MKNLGIVGGGLLGRLATFVLVNAGYNVNVYEKTSRNPPVGARRSAGLLRADLVSDKCWDSVSDLGRARGQSDSGVDASGES